jgi:hypothetical protein
VPSTRTTCSTASSPAFALGNNSHLLTLFLSVFEITCTEYARYMTMDELKPYHVTRWLQKMSKPRIDTYGRTVFWSESNHGFVMAVLKAALNWGKKQGLISHHCLGNVETAQRGHKGEEAYVSKEVFDKVCADTNQNFRDLLVFIRNTGCRPDEAYHLEARCYRPADECFVGNVGSEFMSRNPRQAVRQPATKFAHLQKKMQNQKPPKRAGKKK